MYMTDPVRASHALDSQLRPQGVVVYQSKRFQIVQFEENKKGSPVRLREVIEHPGSVVIIPLIEGDRICLIANRRPAVGATLLELPAGTLDRPEELEQAARRELSEETGYSAVTVRPIGSYWMSPGILCERMHVFVAEGLSAGPQALEPGEDITLNVVSWSDAIAMCLDGRIEDAKTIASLLMFDAIRRNT